MPSGRGLKRQAVAAAKEPVCALVFIDGLERAGDVLRRIGVTGIVQRDQHQQRLRRERIEQIGPVDPARERRHDVLLGIVGGSRGLDVGFGEVLGVALGDHGHADPAVERRQELRQRRAARLAAAADPLGVDFGPRQQVVDPADAVPRAEQAEVGAEEDQATPGVLVLARSAVGDRGLAGAVARVLDAFPLAERVVRKNHIAFAGQVGEQLLVARPGLAVL